MTQVDQTAQTTASPAPGGAGAADEEWVQSDDRVIGRAVKWSLLALVIALAGLGFAWYWAHRTPPPPPVKKTEVLAPAVPVRPEAQIPDAKFTDITQSAGITFVHVNGAYGDKLLPET